MPEERVVALGRFRVQEDAVVRSTVKRQVRLSSGAQALSGKDRRGRTVTVMDAGDVASTRARWKTIRAGASSSANRAAGLVRSGA
ncbi:hypothetical protein M4914_15770 [Streptomyces somaliensis DSM 40738]|uniref:Uncharacterized protein n=1 Tax=Streptomyces somaliensis (strain ATCC 33201 / DSM 40738 / JCM 12659 / KCTC 9044 / NCTC 11332 / NRRL B-12077 / IP 733) TaxID=1134445 RepID=A0AA44DAS0_STRE0|nr:hypothetical protein [Streptomyces somaliensis]MCQ0024270.1 hypothetical protein [Streptomyces somaliensis DSM 40738]NKY12881.1 hypothetical protein [Streptomyces somaliensis DSM 40738]